ncbi:MAG TPA: FliM/FliN family flagellar motor switch protein, partial [Kaistiaceae bacterium]|nr:FliM/FliN family flagellar motor switch protein [Kaistiaceae bacterium]
GEIMKLNIGDTLVFEARPEDPVLLKCGDVSLTEGNIGRIDKHISVRVNRDLRRPRTTLAAFEKAVSSRSEVA